MSQQQPPFYPQMGNQQPLIQGGQQQMQNPQQFVPGQNPPAAQGGSPPLAEYFFPKKAKVDKSHEAFQLRAACRNLIIGHFLCLILAFAFISSITGVGQVLYIAILFSISQTLKTWMVYVYCLVLGINLVSGVLSVMTLTSGFIWYGAILFYYFLAIKVIWTESGPFRSSVRTNVNHSNHGSNALSENLISSMATTFQKQLPKNVIAAGPQMPPPPTANMQAPIQQYAPANNNTSFNQYPQQQNQNNNSAGPNNNYFPPADPEANFFDQLQNQQQQQQVNQTYQDQNQSYFNDMSINNNNSQQYHQYPPQQDQTYINPNNYNNAYQQPNNGYYQQQQQYPVMQQQQQQEQFNPENVVANAVAKQLVKQAKNQFKLSNLANMFEDKDFRNNQPPNAPRGY